MEEDDPNNQKVNRIPLVAVLLAGAFVAILNQTLLVTAIPPIMADLNITANTGQWLNSVFMLVNGIMIPITAFLIGKFTTRKLFMTAMGLFAFGTLVAGISPNFEVLILGRVIQASGAGIMIPLMQTVLFLVFPVEKRGQAMGLVGMVIAFAPAIGPTLSGYIVDQFPWRALFFIILPIALADMIIAYFILKNVTEQTFPKLDIRSIMLSTFGFGGLLYAFSVAGMNGWTSTSVLVWMGIGALSLLWFILRQLKLPEPILEFRVFKSSIFALTNVIGVVVFMSMIGAATILPIYMQDMQGFTAFESGLMLMPGAIVMGVMNPITGRIFDKIGARWLAISGMTVLTVSNFLFTNLSEDTGFAYMAIIHSFRMLSLAMVMMPVTTAGLNSLPDRLIPHGTAMNNTLRQVGGSLGTAFLVTVMTVGAGFAPEGTAESAMIYGVNLSFWVTTVLAFIGLIIATFVKHPPKSGTTVQTDDKQDEKSG
ncbi:MDR family MFS transporter [Salisediminibacterium halotolerans]|uniref:MDR family MFS transporter n=1 Tax=Salisediminibacterium halotolerans TaxID=517425 RepID=UPI000EB0AA61|nr:MDR family MFS transporter [Salisediminibacterium halotolerans]RLJ74404.1 EmrB/QacA subfamily drug resistance transporter [Actinophytocola xinjiangensis]RPE87503.1 EmrB/QacA subfamily drug resistance transporter [Salisediminibacterium halotolerans]TWG35241.1 EmrB/QacA subfamily drug resistance transporter [Salisediminibacterium halotolerans]GEL09231.1 putative MFS-type transporter YcnB [Salisediminibacterium halotolerans]